MHELPMLTIKAIIGNSELIDYADMVAFANKKFGYVLKDIEKKYKLNKDRKAKILSLAMLTSALNHSPYSIRDVKYTDAGKPYINNWYHYNISHSDNIVSLTYSHVTIGIDIEKIKDIELSSMEGVFHGNEKKVIALSCNKIIDMYSLWTKKESFLKATGTGITEQLQNIDCSSDKIHFYNGTWFFHKINIDNSFVGHICTPLEDCEIEIYKFDGI